MTAAQHAAARRVATLAAHLGAAPGAPVGAAPCRAETLRGVPPQFRVGPSAYGPAGVSVTVRVGPDPRPGGLPQFHRERHTDRFRKAYHSASDVKSSSSAAARAGLERRMAGDGKKRPYTLPSEPTFQTPQAAGLNRPRRAPGRRVPAPWAPRLEEHEEAGSFVVHAELPGVAHDALRVELVGRNLLISGHGAGSRVEGGRAPRGPFHATWRLPPDADAAAVDAELQDGVLVVTVQKLAGRPVGPPAVSAA